MMLIDTCGSSINALLANSAKLISQTHCGTLFQLLVRPGVSRTRYNISGFVFVLPDVPHVVHVHSRSCQGCGSLFQWDENCVNMDWFRTSQSEGGFFLLMSVCLSVFSSAHLCSWGCILCILRSSLCGCLPRMSTVCSFSACVSISWPGLSGKDTILFLSAISSSGKKLKDKCQSASRTVPADYSFHFWCVNTVLLQCFLIKSVLQWSYHDCTEVSLHSWIILWRGISWMNGQAHHESVLNQYEVEYVFVEFGPVFTLCGFFSLWWLWNQYRCMS